MDGGLGRPASAAWQLANELPAQSRGSTTAAQLRPWREGSRAEQRLRRRRLPLLCAHSGAAAHPSDSRPEQRSSGKQQLGKPAPASGWPRGRRERWAGPPGWAAGPALPALLHSRQSPGVLSLETPWRPRKIPGNPLLSALTPSSRQATYEKLMTEVPKYKMITPSVRGGSQPRFCSDSFTCNPPI